MKKIMKKIKISAIDSYFFAAISGIIISAIVLLTSSIAYAADADQLECSDLSNEILKRQNAGTFFKPIETKIEYLKDSLEYTQSLKKLYAEEKEIKKITRGGETVPLKFQKIRKGFYHATYFAACYRSGAGGNSRGNGYSQNPGSFFAVSFG